MIYFSTSTAPPLTGIRISAIGRGITYVSPVEADIQGPANMKIWMLQKCFSCSVLLLKWLHLQLRKKFFFSFSVHSQVPCVAQTPSQITRHSAYWRVHSTTDTSSWGTLLLMSPQEHSLLCSAKHEGLLSSAESGSRRRGWKNCWSPNLTLSGLNGRPGSVCGTAEPGCECWMVKWGQEEGQRTMSTEDVRGCPEELTQGRALGSLSRPCPHQERAVPGCSQSYWL